MSTASDIVRRALRAMGAIAAGKVPAGNDAASGVEYLQSLILDLPGLVKNGRWREVAVAAAYTAMESDRCTVTGSGAVTLPTTVTDCETGCTRPPKDLARVQVVGSVANAGVWIYSATNAAWGKVTGLTIASTMPFGAEDDEGLAFMLAVNMAGEFGAEGELGQRTIILAQEAARSFRSRFKKAQPTDWSRPEPFSALSSCNDGLGLSGCDY